MLTAKLQEAEKTRKKRKQNGKGQTERRTIHLWKVANNTIAKSMVAYRRQYHYCVPWKKPSGLGGRTRSSKNQPAGFKTNSCILLNEEKSHGFVWSSFWSIGCCVAAGCFTSLFFILLVGHGAVWIKPVSCDRDICCWTVLRYGCGFLLLHSCCVVLLWLMKTVLPVTNWNRIRFLFSFYHYTPYLLLMGAEIFLGMSSNVDSILLLLILIYTTEVLGKYLILQYPAHCPGFCCCYLPPLWCTGKGLLLAGAGDALVGKSYHILSCIHALFHWQGYFRWTPFQKFIEPWIA